MDDSLFGMLFDEEVIKNKIDVSDKKYTSNTYIGQYEPTGEKPSYKEMYDTGKYDMLMKEIEESNVSEADKKFLRLAAARHIVFTYDKIADYYAHSSKEMQELMESSALVLIDLNDAIGKGYVTMSKQIAQLQQQDKITYLAKKQQEAEERAAKKG